MRWKDAPDSGPQAGQGEKIMNATFKSPMVNFMAADARPTTQYGESRVSLSLATEDTEEAKRVFDSLSRGGKVEMPLEKVFWGALFGMFQDRYGIDWMVNCQLAPVPAG